MLVDAFGGIYLSIETFSSNAIENHISKLSTRSNQLPLMEQTKQYIFVNITVFFSFLAFKINPHYVWQSLNKETVKLLNIFYVQPLSN